MARSSGSVRSRAPILPGPRRSARSLDRVELDISHLAAGGDGIGRASDGRVVLCEGALPGERVEATVVLERRDFLRARTVAVLQASPDRRDPACPHVAEGCGGCTWPYVRAGAPE